MSSTNTDETIVLDTGHYGIVWAVAFYSDGKHFLSGVDRGIQRWRVEDGQKVTEQMGMDSELCAICVSTDHKWVISGTREGASVWDGEIHGKVVDVASASYVGTLDISPDSTSFATGTGGRGNTDNTVNIWNVTNGERLVGPLGHESHVTGVKFSPSGDHIATSCYQGTSIRIFSSLNGDELFTIQTTIHQWTATTPLAWSIDSQQLLAISNDRTIRCFDVSTSSQVVESPILDGTDIFSLALAANGKFIATFTRPRAISFLDALALTRIGPVVEDNDHIRSIAISPDSSCLAIGREDGKIVLRDLGKILPDSYGPFHEGPGKSSSTKSEEQNEDNDGDLLEHEVSSNAPAPEFDFEEPPSPVSSANHQENETPLMDLPSKAHPRENIDPAESTRVRSIFRKLLQRESNKGSASKPHTPGRRFGKSPQPPDRQSPSHSPTKVDATNKGPSWMAAAERNARTSTGFPRRRKRKPPTNLAVTNRLNEASSSGQGATDRRAADPAQQANDPSQPSSRGVHITHQSDEGNATLAITFPAWLLCIRSDAHDRAD